MKVISLKCPNCGAPLTSDDATCRFCQAIVSFAPDAQQFQLLGFPCPKCQAPNDKGVRFCAKCGAPLITKCPSCRHDMPLESIVCPHCRASRIVQGLIAEADARKARATAEANAEIASIERQAQDHGCFFSTSKRLADEAAALQDDVARRRQGLGRMNTLGIVFITLAFVLGCLSFGAVPIITGTSANYSATAVFLPYCLSFVVFAALLAAGLYWFRRKSAESKAMVSTEARIAAMRAPNAWQTFATSEERKLIDRVLQWRDGEKARVLGQLRAKREEIDKWLEESTDNLA